LNNPNVNLEIVEDVLQDLNQTETLNYSNINLLLGSSAVGKMKALNDITTHRYFVFLDANGAACGQEDIVKMMRNIDYHVTNRNTIVFCESYFIYIFIESK
jgi:hypothetical protein